MKWDVEYTDEFGDWWEGLSETEQIPSLRRSSCWKSLGHIWGIHTVQIFKVQNMDT